MLIFETQQAAQDVLDAIHALAASYLEAQGFTVRHDADSPSGLVVVDKRGDGTDSPSGSGMTCWAIPELATDGRWYFPDPNGTVPALAGWREQMPEGLVVPDTVDRPAEWAIDVEM